MMVGCALPVDGETDPNLDEDALVGSVASALSNYSCTERGDTGYVSGSPFDIVVVTVQDKPVEVSTANAYIHMATAAEADGVNLRIVSGFRTNAEQQHLYYCYTSCTCNGCNLAAHPGYSNHQSGHALDLNTSSAGVLNWLNHNGAHFGFSRTVPSEDWHWEFWGDDPGDGPCGRRDPPTAEDCPDLPADGGVVEETSGCFYAHGPAAYWRHEDGAGHGGSLLWTNAWESDTPSDWARWYLRPRRAGRYSVQVWAEPGFAVFRRARYVVRHDGVEDELIVDLSGASGWLELGTFDMGTGNRQNVSVYDDSPTAVPADQHIPADAVRLVPAPDLEVPPLEEEPPSIEMAEPGTDAGVGVGAGAGPGAITGGCDVAARRGEGLGWTWLGAMLVLFVRRRRR